MGAPLANPIDSLSTALLDPTSDFFWHDAAHILLSNATGGIQWQNTFADNVKGDYYPSTITTGSPTAPFEVLVIAMTSGFLFSYNTQGIPVAGINLGNTSTDPTPSYLPVAPPITSGYRVFLVARSVDHRATEDGRVYAYDVRDVAVDRMALAWYVGVARGEAEEADGRGSVMEPVVVVGSSLVLMTKSNQVTILHNVVVAASSDEVTVVEVPPFGFTVGKTAATDVVFAADSSGKGVWMMSRTESNFLYRVSLEEGKCTRSIDVRKMLGVDDGREVVLSSRLTGFDCEGSPSDGCMLLSVGHRVVVLSLELDEEKILWTFSLPSKETVTGQIAVMVRGGDSRGEGGDVVVVRTESGVRGLLL